MKIIVCVKAVRQELVFINKVQQSTYVINPYDLLALQNAINIKNTEACTIDCISMGPDSIREVLVKCLALGSDNAYWLNDKAFAGADTIVTTYVLSKGISKIGEYDLIICGEQTVDGETGQVGIGLAERLNIPCITNVEEIIDFTDKYIIVCVKYEDHEEVLKIQLPALVVFKNFKLISNTVSLLHLKKAQRKEIVRWSSNDLCFEKNWCGLAQAKTRVVNVTPELIVKEGRLISGNAKKKAVVISQLIQGRFDADNYG
ncbi:electron transfer flavoprotein subunit beta/FixA family protein [Lacrimispora algidixylanolytica]|uniref:Electron transfer flavoprotein small subunit n=1 Tax=Lacrimispora algidixylanolytica TaxID=94868 RepID=A0A419T1M7_9FIRM|nr:electron transfer flavoprotein subunit beta/FixA family protein [Lacrimispora algidixylanolytica]RKD31353.1 hypothetical protein BET01_20770 [Lacrimispora algidixylanolytica]